MPIEGKEEFQSILIENLYGRIKQGDRKKFSIRTIADRQHIVSHFQCSGMD